MINCKKNHELGDSIAKHIIQIMKSIKTREVTVKQLEQTIANMKQNPKKDFVVNHASKQFFVELYKNKPHKP